MGVGGKWGGRLFEAGRLLTFSAFRMGAYSRWALIRGWALIRINTVFTTYLQFLLLRKLNVSLVSTRSAKKNTLPLLPFPSFPRQHERC